MSTTLGVEVDLAARNQFEFKPEKSFNLSVVSIVAILWLYSLTRYWLADNHLITQLVYCNLGDFGVPALILPMLFIAAVVIHWSTNSEGMLRQRDIAIAGLASGLMIVASASNTPLPSQPGLWAGFGLVPTAVASLVAITSMVPWHLLRLKPLPLLHSKLIQHVLAISVLAWYLPLYLQPLNGLINLGDTSYHVIDELLAPAMGAFPYANYSPQYTGFLGWVTLPLMYLPVSELGKMWILIATANIFNLLVPILVVLIIRCGFPQLPKLATLAAFVSIWTISGSERGASVQIREFANFARLVPVLVSLLLLLWMLRSSNDSQCFRSKLTGISCGISCLNSLDSGAPWSICLVVTLAIAAKNNWIAWRILRQFLGSLVLTIVSYPLLLVALGERPLASSYLGLRVLGRDIYYFGGGIPSVTAAHVLVLALAVTSISYGLEILRDRNKQLGQDYSPIIALALGLWMLALLTKYLVFPHPVGLPSLFAPSFIVGALLVRKIDFSNFKRRNLTNRIAAFPIVFLTALPVGSVWNAPDVRDEIKRISGEHVGTTDWSRVSGRVSDGWSPRALSRSHNDFIEEVIRLKLLVGVNNESVGYFGIFGHTIELLTGVDNVIGIPAPESLRFGVSQALLACVPVDKREPDYILVYSTSFPCSGYERDSQYSTNHIFVYRRL